MKAHVLSILISYAVIFTSCFKEDEAVPSYIPPEDVETASLQNSIYEYQIYFDLSTGEIAAENENSVWVLGFECGSDNFHIRINSSDFWGVANSGSTNMNSTYSDNTVYNWKSDRSDGDPDSTAVGSWVSFESGIPVYSDEVYLVGKYDGISYEPLKKVQFIYVDDQSYKFLVAGLNDSNADTIFITKDDDFNYVHYSFQENKVMHLEPNKYEWDIMFCQYFTILFTDDGTPAPYYVRGALLNPNNVESALDTIAGFNEINYTIALSNLFSAKQDAIGHDWKAVTVDEGTNSAEYNVRSGYTYIIKDPDAVLYKLRFTSFFNQLGVRGYPSFEYSKLIPE